jgi:GGDEF domain-containing protein
MTIALNHTALAVAPAAVDVPVDDVTTLLPQRDAVVENLAARLPTAGTQTTSLLVFGLLRRDDGWPTPQRGLAAVTSFLARSLRGDDWLGSAGPAEFAILLAGDESAAETAAHRLVHAVAASVQGLSAAAGVTLLSPHVSAAEVLRRGMLSLTAARRVGPGTVIRHRQPS